MGIRPDSTFPFRTSLSLDGLFDFWERLRDDPASPMRHQAAKLLERIDRTPAFRGRVDGAAIADLHPDIVEELMSPLFPVSDESALGSIGEPFKFENLYETPAARRLGLFSEGAFFAGTENADELMEKGSIIAAYEMILQQIYGRTDVFQYPLILSLADHDTGLQRHFQLWWDSQFCKVVPRGDIPRPSPEELKRLIGEPTNFDLWFELLPPDRFELAGAAITRAADVTMREAISRLKDDLLEHGAMATPARIDRLQGRIRTVLGLPDLTIGLIGFDRSEDIESIRAAFPAGRSLLLSSGHAPDCPHKKESNYAAAFKSREPVVVSDLEHAPVCTGFEYHLMESGLRSLMVLPLFTQDRLIGLLEVASPHAGELTAFSAFRLYDVTAPFATALQRSIDERADRIQSVIKQRYTAIHPSVEWRFRNAAKHLLQQDEGDELPIADQIVFPDVYPLYGLTDIRGSSDTRSHAIQSDLLEQLRLALDVVDEARSPAFPVLEQTGYRIRQFIARIEAGLHSEDETAAIGFLSRELEPFLDQLAGWNESVAERVGQYREALHPELGVLYRSRKLFDDSVTRFNEAVSAVIDREQVVAQSVFPHFFEQFQTDGVDYNVYVGESIAEDGGFSDLYLHNLRLWQLKLVCRIEWELTRVRPDLGVPLSGTHLILVQDQPLAIRFRTAEKRFDVDGAYNIRYELVKKRIDKARIRGTSERLTQPGMLAVVYSQVHEGQEYRRYLEYLIAAGYLTGDIEEHLLEDMQGVLGLRAFRVAINETPSGSLRKDETEEALAEVGRLSDS